MSMVTNTLGRYFAGRFVVSAVGVFASVVPAYRATLIDPVRTLRDE